MKNKDNNIDLLENIIIFEEEIEPENCYNVNKSIFKDKFKFL
jgi:hypothetical protein